MQKAQKGKDRDMAKKSNYGISVIVKDASGQHVNRIKSAAEAKGIPCEIVNLHPNLPLDEQIKQLADVVIYRSSSLDLQSERASVAPYLDVKFVINEAVFRNPFTPYKYFQQNVLTAAEYTHKFAIPTYRAKSVQALETYLRDGSLKFPFIVKPNKGAQGEGIELIRNSDDLRSFVNRCSIQDYVFQNFITNTGDWRVIVVGSRPLGVIKRTSPQGTFLNNLSQGATSTAEKDPKILSIINDMAVKAASAMNLRYCGVDIIRDEETGAYYVLETNTAPQWIVPQQAGNYFQDATGVDVAEELVDYSIDLLNRGRKPAADLVEEYYKRNINYSAEATFHFASRLWLWTGDNWARQSLDEAQQSYIGTNEAEITATIDKIVADFSVNGFSLSNSKTFRRQYFEKYPKLALYNKLFFKMLFADSIYGLDIRPQLRKHMNDDELIAIFEQIKNDHDAIRVLSTHAINFLYLLRYYFRDDKTQLDKCAIDPAKFIEISRGYDSQIERGELDEYTAQKMRIYLLTHAIIGESQFYQREVAGYEELVREIERAIANDFTGTSLDNKNEFLVCAKICNQKTYLESIILDESANSLSWAGNFIVESCDWGSKSILHSLSQAEHRNVLFVLANREFRHAEQGKNR